MIFFAIIGGMAAALALAGLYDFRVRRRGAQSYIVADTFTNHLSGCQQQVWRQPNIGVDGNPRR
jgi:hypothetical protein